MLKGISGKGGTPVPQSTVSCLSNLPMEVIRWCLDGLPLSLKTVHCVREQLSTERRVILWKLPWRKIPWTQWRDPNNNDGVISLLSLLFIMLVSLLHTISSVFRGKKNTGHSSEGFFFFFFLPFFHFFILKCTHDCYKSIFKPCLFKIKMLTFNVTIAKMI